MQWQDLGDLPYRRIRLYSNVVWGREDHAASSDAATTNNPVDHPQQQQQPSSKEERFGLSWYPKPYVDTLRAHQSSVLGRHDNDTDTPHVRSSSTLAALLSTTTVTFVAACPNGGPIASVTAPLTTNSAGFGSKTTLRILQNGGGLVACISFPPRDVVVMTTTSSSTTIPGSKFAATMMNPGDILTVGWTARCILVVVLRNSLTLCYDMEGRVVLPPFYALMDRSLVGGKQVGSSSSSSSGTTLLEASVYEGGVAVLGTNGNAAVVELFDEHDDPSYADGADVTSWRVVSSSVSSLGKGDAVSSSPTSSTNFAMTPPPHYALVTPLPTGMFAKSKHFSYGCIAVLPRQYAPSRRPELFLSTSDGSVVVAEVLPSTSPNNGLTDVDCRFKIGQAVGSSSGGGGTHPSPSPIVSMSFAPNGRFLACFTANSVLAVLSTTFESIVLEFDTSAGGSSPPRSMGWCGEDSVVMYMKNLGVLMVGPYGDWLRFPCGQEEDGAGGDHVYLVPEMDCCRVITSSSVEILQRVPPVTADLLRIAGALLLDASDAFDAGSPNAEEAARSITQQEGLLEEAIRQCIAAAEGEFDIKLQKRLLRAASYGLHFACRDENSYSRKTGRPSPEAVTFVKAARKLRTLNAIRKPSTGFAMTSAQYDSVTPKGVVARLMAAGHPSLASCISEYLRLGRQVRDYARAMKAAAFVTSCSALSSTNASFSIMTDSQIAEEAIRIIRGETKGAEKLSEKERQTSVAQPSSGMYSSVALAAHRAGRRGVADLLIMLEQSPVDKVHALLSIGSYADAAAVAARARDPDLIFAAMSAYDRSVSDNDDGKNTYFSGVINKFPMEAVNMLTAYFSRIAGLGGDVKPMVSILLRRQRHAEAGSKMAKRAMALVQNASSIMAENELEDQKVETLKEASNIFSLAGKDCAFQKACTDDYIDLIADQEQLRQQYGTIDVAPPSSSVTSTITSILQYAATNPRSAHLLFSDADKLAKKYKVSEKRLWHVKVHAFSSSGQWAVLRNFADSRTKSPIGMKPFALAAIRGRQGEAEIMHYVGRMQGQSDGEDRYELFCEAGMWRKAVDEAVKLGDGRRIAHVRSVCNSIDIQNLCDKYI
eukprot:CCRYP_019093-RB/>CCRYP_019093-RB protein AED:0.21 eAED:0.21 QI:0/0/0/1/1/1/2/0/1104